MVRYVRSWVYDQIVTLEELAYQTPIKLQNCAPFTFRGRCLRSLTVRAHSSPASAKKVAPGKHNGVGLTGRIFAFVSSTPDETKEAFRNWAVKHNGCICCREEGASAFRWNCLFKVPSAVFKLCFSDNLTLLKAYDANEIFIYEHVKKSAGENTEHSEA